MISMINGIRKTALWKIAPKKITPQKFPTRKFPPENCPLWIFPPMKAPPLWKLSPRNMPLIKITPHEFLSPLINHTNERKSKITKFFCLKEICATQHPYQNNQGPLWYTDDLTENTGLLYRMKKIQKSN